MACRAAAAPTGRLLARHFNVEEVLTEAKLRLPGETIRIRTQSIQKIFDFLLHFSFAAGVRKIHRVLLPLHLIFPGQIHPGATS